MSKKNKLSPSEAIFGFCAWLTTREKITVMSGHHDSAPIVEAIKVFCEVNGLAYPREDWTDYLTHPKDSEKSLLDKEVQASIPGDEEALDYAGE